MITLVCGLFYCLRPVLAAVALFGESPLEYNPTVRVETSRIRQHSYETLVFSESCPNQIVLRRLAHNEYYARIQHKLAVDWTSYYYLSNDPVCEPEPFKVYELPYQCQEDDLRFECSSQ